MTTNQAGNPFESTQPARQYFVGRQQELVEIRGYLDTVTSGGSTNLYVLGAGGFGKTSLLYKILEEATQKGLVGCLITLSDGMEPDEIIHQVVEAIVDEIGIKFGRKEYYEDFQLGKESRFRVAIDKANGNSISPRNLQKDFERLNEIAQEIATHGFVLCIDEGQWLRTNNGGALFLKIRGAVQAVGKHFMIILSSLDDIIPEISQGASGVDRFFPNTINIGPFENDNVAINAIEKRLENRALAIEREVSQLIVDIAGRNPKEIIDICHDLYADATVNMATGVSLGMVKKVVFQRFNHKVTYVLNAIGHLKPSHESTLRKLLQLGGRASLRDVAQVYCQHSDEDCIERMGIVVQQELEFLVDLGLCGSTDTGPTTIYQIVSGLVAFILRSELGQLPSNQRTT